MRTMLIAILVLVYLGSAHGRQAGKSVDLGGDDTTSSNTDQGPDCECVHYNRCLYLNNMRQSYIACLIDRGLLGTCASTMHVCCMKSRVIKENDVRTTPVPNTSATCGRRNPEGVGLRITGDNDGDAQYGEFPWMVALLKQEALEDSDQRLKVYKCGGSLIHPKVVLTAAHCVAGNLPEDLMIRAGEWDSASKNELLPHQDRLVSKVITHEGFSEGPLYNDIALLILHEPVAEAEHIGFVCLPKAGKDMDRTRCFVSGWGKNVTGKEGRFQSVLKKIELPIVPRPDCLEALRKTRLGSHFKLHGSFICAGGEADRDACEGDAGSPLVCPVLHDPLHYQQAGIVAWGIGCGEDRTPGVYTNVAHSRNWIDQKMIENNLDTTSYSY